MCAKSKMNGGLPLIRVSLGVVSTARSPSSCNVTSTGLSAPGSNATAVTKFQDETPWSAAIEMLTGETLAPAITTGIAYEYCESLPGSTANMFTLAV